MLYSNGAVPPVAIAVMLPLLVLQNVVVGTAVTVGPGAFFIVTCLTFVQPVESFTVSV